ncbi:hypothetical protein K502DRAFT_351263 [Neoconidiobolus thromboides FSU 785]|nr:hypothetical protein K502DRAFT_351263 [Neoconidiobolus thromboides FSU 785]
MQKGNNSNPPSYNEVTAIKDPEQAKMSTTSNTLDIINAQPITMEMNYMNSNKGMQFNKGTESSTNNPNSTDQYVSGYTTRSSNVSSCNCCSNATSIYGCMAFGHSIGLLLGLCFLCC